VFVCVMATACVLVCGCVYSPYALTDHIWVNSYIHPSKIARPTMNSLIYIFVAMCNHIRIGKYVHPCVCVCSTKCDVCLFSLDEMLDTYNKKSERSGGARTQSCVEMVSIICRVAKSAGLIGSGVHQKKIGS